MDLVKGLGLIAILLVLGLAGTSLAEPRETLRGRFTVVWGDPLPGSGGLVFRDFHLFTDDGSKVRLLVDSTVMASGGGIASLAGRDVVVTVEGAVYGRGTPEEARRALSIDLDESKHRSSTDVSGPKHWINILCKFADDGVEPQGSSYFQDGLFGSEYPGMDHYWREVSYDTVSITSATAGWYTLPHPRSYYVDDDAEDGRGADLDALLIDCGALADIDLGGAEGLNLMFNLDLDCCAWGGQACIYESWLSGWCGSVTWEPPWGYQNQQIIAHEMGHGFGLPHSNNSDGDDDTYDNPWDVMSDTWSFGSWFWPYGNIGQHTISYHKRSLGWIPDADVFPFGGGVQTIELERLAQPIGNGYLMAVIPVDQTRYYTLEARVRVGYDVSLPGDGVIIHEIDPSRWEPAWLVQEFPSNPSGDDGEVWTVGEVYENAADGITITVEAATSTGWRISSGTCGDGVVLLTEECDDGNAVDGDGCDTNCTFTACGNGVLTAGEECDDGNTDEHDGCSSLCTVVACGNGVTEQGEECDDGDTDNGDGCSALCEIEREQTKAQQKCLNALNKAGWKLAKAQGKAIFGCIKNTGKGTEFDPQFCLTADVKGKVAKAQSSLTKAGQRKCNALPDFGYAEVDAISAAAVAEELGLVADVFGDNLNPVLNVLEADKPGAKCQAAVAKDYDKLISVKLDAFVRCKKAGLKSGYINSGARLTGCFDAVVADPKGKVEKTTLKLKSRMFSKCVGLGIDRSALFPGLCTDEDSVASLSNCMVDRVDCRACQMLNAFDGLSEDCDTFDDGVLNASCQ